MARTTGTGPSLAKGFVAVIGVALLVCGIAALVLGGDHALVWGVVGFVLVVLAALGRVGGDRKGRGSAPGRAAPAGLDTSTRSERDTSWDEEVPAGPAP